MMTDRQLQTEVLQELEFEPAVDPEQIGVSVDHGVVTLSGCVESYAEKLAAERAARRVYSAKAVVNDLEVPLAARDDVPDQELAQAIVGALDGLANVPADSVRVTVRHGHVALEGMVGLEQESKAAEEAVRRVRGVREVRNHIAVKPTQTSAADVQAQIAGALRRHAAMDASRIVVERTNGKVVLRGDVRCARQRDEAVAAAWGAEGVVEVEDCLMVEP